MRKIILAGLIICAGFMVFAKEETKMREVANGKEKFYTNSIEREELPNGVKLTRDYGTGEVEVFNFGKDGVLKQWSVTKEKMNIVVNREGNNLLVKGTANGEKVDKKLSINDNVWYGSPSTAISDMVKGGKKSLIFWMVAQADLSAREMSVNVEGEEKVLGIDTYKIKITLTGMMSMFWSANYWVDKSNGSIIRYQGTRGPGTPETIIEIVKK